MASGKKVEANMLPMLCSWEYVPALCQPNGKPGVEFFKIKLVNLGNSSIEIRGITLDVYWCYLDENLVHKVYSVI